jgi:hypothetical protein
MCSFVGINLGSPRKLARSSKCIQVLIKSDGALRRMLIHEIGANSYQFMHQSLMQKEPGVRYRLIGSTEMLSEERPT